MVKPYDFMLMTDSSQLLLRRSGRTTRGKRNLGSHLPQHLQKTKGSLGKTVTSDKKMYRMEGAPLIKTTLSKVGSQIQLNPNPHHSASSLPTWCGDYGSSRIRTDATSASEEYSSSSTTASACSPSITRKRSRQGLTSSNSYSHFDEAGSTSRAAEMESLKAEVEKWKLEATRLGNRVRVLEEGGGGGQPQQQLQQQGGGGERGGEEMMDVEGDGGQLKATGCELLVEQTRQALLLLNKIWRETAVQLQAREDLLDDLTTLKRTNSLSPPPSSPTSPSATSPSSTSAAAVQQQGGGGGGGQQHGEGGGGGAEMQTLRRQASFLMNQGESKAIRTSLWELRTLLKQMKPIEKKLASSAAAATTVVTTGTTQQGGREGGGTAAAMFKGGGFASQTELHQERERMEKLHSWLLSSKDVLRGLYARVQEVLSRAQAQRSSEEFQKRLQESGQCLKALERDLSLRVTDVEFAVNCLCQMKGEVEGGGEKVGAGRREGGGRRDVMRKEPPVYGEEITAID